MSENHITPTETPSAKARVALAQPKRGKPKMSKFDKVLHLIGSVAAGTAALGAAGALALPAPILALAAIVAYACGAQATPFFKKPNGN